MRSDGTYDFLHIVESKDKFNRKVFTPTFIIKSNTKDLMIRGRKFYAIVNPENNMWEKDINVAMELIDKQVFAWVVNKVGQQIMDDPDYSPIIKKVTDTVNGLSKKFRTFCEVDMEDRYKLLNQKVKFSNSEIKLEDYATYKLPYPLQDGPTPYYDRLVNTLYLPDEKRKFEYLTGAIIAGDQSKIQKFFVFYGEPGSGKSTIISKIIAEMIFGGDDAPYTAGFKAEMLVNKDQFGTEFLSYDPILAYDDEAELSRVDTCTVINKIVAHESTRVNSKYGRAFQVKPNCFLVCGTNEVVQLSPRSGFNRRLIDIRQTGVKLSPEDYDECMTHIQFERSGIAAHCLKVYKECGKNYYNHYLPEDMLVLSSPFHNFVKDNYTEIHNGTTLANAYSLYEIYAEACNFKTIMTRLKFRDQLKLYFEEYGDRDDGDGKVTKSWFSSFRDEKLGLKPFKGDLPNEPQGWLNFNSTKSIFDELYFNRPAQYAKDDGTPKIAWADVKTLLDTLDTSKLHYVRTPEELIVIDFDIKDSSGNKSYEKNLEAANKFPPTYAELSKSGSGIHLHYIWTGGDPDELSRVYGDNIEVKVFKGNAALRRQLTRCNDLPIAELSSGLPKKEVKKMVDWEGFKNEKALRAQIVKAVNKEYIEEGKIPSTKSSIDFIDHILDEAYMSGVSYDVSDLQESVLGLALSSTNKADYCMNLVSYMHFKSKDQEEKEANHVTEEYEKAPIIFFDIESYCEGEDPEIEPALFIVCWKFQGKDQKVTKMINPSPDAVKELFNYRMIGFNNRDYDNHMVWARSMGYTEAELNRLSQRLIGGDAHAKFREAYNVSYTDVYDFASAGNKKSLKKWEIELGIHHVEMSIPWDKPAPKDRWDDIAEYCCNDVIATEAVFDHLYSDFVAREILADLSGRTVNDKTNTHTIAILTGGIDNPKSNYIYTDLSQMTWPDGSLMFPGYEYNQYGIPRSRYKPGVKIVSGKSIYKGIDPGEGGRKIGYPGMYSNVALLDVSSMHPHSAIRLNIFGDEITKRYEALVEGRVAIKHGEYEKAVELLKFLGKDLSKYFQGSEEEIARNTAGLADAIKTAVNSVYGLTSASFDNELRDPRNVDNIVAKYGALFMVNLEEEVTNMGYTVAHISTDSIKVANADQKIIDYLMQRAKDYGYTFEFEALYEKMTLVNEAVYIAKYADENMCMSNFNYIPGDNKKAFKKGKMWTATGKQFAVPYVYKTLFSHEPIIFEDMNETFNVVKGAIYLDYKENLPDVNVYEDPYKKLVSAMNKRDKLAKEYADPKVFAMENNKTERTKEEVLADIEKNKKLINKINCQVVKVTGLPEGTDPNEALDVLLSEIDKGHDYRFVGRVGSFAPMIQGVGGAEMVCINGNKYAPTSPSGSKGYHWLETEVVIQNGKQDCIDRSYYRKLVDDAVDTISQYGDFEWFIK